MKRAIKINVLVIFVLLLISIILSFPIASESGKVGESGTRADEPVVTPANNSMVNWHELKYISVDYGEVPDISGAKVTVESNLTGTIAATLSLNGNSVQINLPKRNCDLGQGEIFHLCPQGEVISTELSNVSTSGGGTQPDLIHEFTVGTARLVVSSPKNDDYVGSNVIVEFTVENHTISGGFYDGPHMHYMYDEVDASNFKLHTNSGPITYTSLPEGYHPLIIDLRTADHIWIGTAASRVIVEVTVDTIEPVMVTEQLRPLPDTENVDPATSIIVPINEQIKDGAQIELKANDKVLTGNLSMKVEAGSSILTFTPTDKLDTGTRFTVGISGVEDLAGNHMLDYNFTFTTIGSGDKQNNAKSGEESFLERYWEPVTVAGAAIISIVGWLMLRRQKANVRRYLDEIDRKVNELHHDLERLDNELAKLREEITNYYRKGKLDENQFLLIEKKLDDSLRTIRERNIAMSLDKTSPELSAAIKAALADGRIKSGEIEQVLNQAENLTPEQHEQLKKLMTKWADKDDKSKP
jgi:hypothetical protein